MVSLAILGGYINSFILISVVGEKLANECLVIGNSIYKTEWHNLEVDIQKDLILVIMRCQKPAYIKAGPYATMTHRTILSILKTAYSVMSLLKAIS
ncbi:unnamed protein product [Phaedon cochleariae]|uniref:Odorant receptor n=1 Tax=Phaedon cochleariae TaxID=80249 RepID=A0A9P0DS46_PHACE|nr:unnamed protein product [Phaedon cochleariae]